MPVIRPTVAVEDLIAEVDLAADRIKELADEPDSDENANATAQQALKGLAALAQLAARRLSQ